MRIALIYRWCIVLMLGLVAQPILAQGQKNSRRNENYTPTKKVRLDITTKQCVIYLDKDFGEQVRSCLTKDLANTKRFRH